MRSGASAGRPGGPGRGLGPQVTSTHEAGCGDTWSPPGLHASPGRDRLCNRVGPGRAPMDSAPREAPWGAPGGAGAFDNLATAVGSARAAVIQDEAQVVPRPQGCAQICHRHSVPRALTSWAWPGSAAAWCRRRGAASRVCSGPGSPSCSPATSPPPQFQSLPLAEEDLAGTRGGLAALGTLPQHPWGASPHVWPSTPGTAPEPAQLGARDYAGASWTGTQPVGVGWGEPSWPPAWPEQLGPDGRKGGCPQLPQAGAGLGRNAMAHERPAGHPTPVTWVRPRARGAPPAWPGPGGARSRPTVAGSKDCHRERETC